jgi:hypothetical protein
MCTVSFDKEALNITVRNQYPGLELILPVCFSTGTTCYVASSQQANDGNILEASFGIDPTRSYFKSALLYKLQRKYVTKTDNKLRNGTASIEDTETNICLLVIWIDDDEHHNCHVCLIEYANDFTWDEDKLWALCNEYSEQLHEKYRSDIIIWSTHDGTAMKTKLDVTYESDYKLDIIISEGPKKYSMKETMKIDPERSVLLL